MNQPAPDTRRYRDLIHLVAPDLVQPLRAAIAAAFAPQGPPTEAIIALTGGEPRALQITVIAALDVVLLHITDVTARVQAQQAAEEATRLLAVSAAGASLLASSNDVGQRNASRYAKRSRA